MTSRRDVLRFGAAAFAAPFMTPGEAPLRQAQSHGSPSPRRVRIAVSTYSYWHLRGPKYPVDKVIAGASASTAWRSCTARWTTSLPRT